MLFFRDTMKKLLLLFLINHAIGSLYGMQADQLSLAEREMLNCPFLGDMIHNKDERISRSQKLEEAVLQAVQDERFNLDYVKTQEYDNPAFTAYMKQFFTQYPNAAAEWAIREKVHPKIDKNKSLIEPSLNKWKRLYDRNQKIEKAAWVIGWCADGIPESLTKLYLNWFVAPLHQANWSVFGQHYYVENISQAERLAASLAFQECAGFIYQKTDVLSRYLNRLLPAVLSREKDDSTNQDFFKKCKEDAWKDAIGLQFNSFIPHKLSNLYTIATHPTPEINTHKRPTSLLSNNTITMPSYFPALIIPALLNYSQEKYSTGFTAFQRNAKKAWVNVTESIPTPPTTRCYDSFGWRSLYVPFFIKWLNKGVTSQDLLNQQKKEIAEKLSAVEPECLKSANTASAYIEKVISDRFVEIETETAVGKHIPRAHFRRSPLLEAFSLYTPQQILGLVEKTVVKNATKIERIMDILFKKDPSPEKTKAWQTFISTTAKLLLPKIIPGA